MHNLQRRINARKRWRRKKEKMMTFLDRTFKTLRIAGAVISFILLMSVLAGGYTTAWFTDASSQSFEMSAGTALFTITEATAGPGPWNPGTGMDFSWTFANTGTKNIRLRARPVVTSATKDSAWGEGTRFTTQGNWATYFTYQVGDPAKTVRLLAGQHHEAGTVTVWTSPTHLHISYQAQDAVITETHLAVAPQLNQIPTAANNNPIPGQFPYQGTHASVGTVTYDVPLAWPAGTDLYIAAHAVVYRQEVNTSILWQLTASCPDHWVRHGDWWYLCQPLPPGEEAKLCLTASLPADAKEGSYTVQLEAEAVQASHNAAGELWGFTPPTSCGNSQP